MAGMHSSTISNLNTLQEKFQDSSLTKAQLVDLMDQFIRDVADGSYAEKGWPDKVPGLIHPICLIQSCRHGLH